MFKCTKQLENCVTGATCVPMSARALVFWRYAVHSDHENPFPTRCGPKNVVNSPNEGQFQVGQKRSIISCSKRLVGFSDYLFFANGNNVRHTPHLHVIKGEGSPIHATIHGRQLTTQPQL